MCIFTNEIDGVENTRIFSRQEGRRQAIVYDLQLSATEETAMVLPIPVAMQASESSVNFIDLSDYPDFFDEIDGVFPQWMSADLETLSSCGRRGIKVHDVGAFNASFVPCPTDFERLDPRFRLDRSFFEQVPEYSNYGFVVFRLQPGVSKVHPMAFWFDKDDKNLFFPTKHMHDGIINETEEFSHTLYAQGRLDNCDFHDKANIENQLMINKSLGLLTKEEPLYKKTVNGENKNNDIWFKTV